jgi:endonuclease YncB( thermonuclease family)
VIWTVPARLRRVVDGDTVHCDLDLGWGVWLGDEPIRLARINAPELRTPDGDAARLFLAAQTQGLLLDSQAAWRCTFTSKGFDRYRRALGELVCPGVGNLSDLMLSSGHAEPYGS